MAQQTIDTTGTTDTLKSGLDKTNANFTELYGIAAAPATAAATAIHGAAAKTIPVDADELGLTDSAASYVLKKSTWANIKAGLKTYFDTLYVAARSFGTAAALNTGTAANNVVQLNASSQLPPVDGSLLTGVVGSGALPSWIYTTNGSPNTAQFTTDNTNLSATTTITLDGVLTSTICIGSVIIFTNEMGSVSYQIQNNVSGGSASILTVVYNQVYGPIASWSGTYQVTAWPSATPAANLTGVVPQANGGAGSASGLLKADGAGNVSAAAAGTDYLAPGGVTIAQSLSASGITPVPDGTYTVGIGGSSNGTITTVSGIITAVQQAS